MARLAVAQQIKSHGCSYITVSVSSINELLVPVFSIYHLIYRISKTIPGIYFSGLGLKTCMIYIFWRKPSWSCWGQQEISFDHRGPPDQMTWFREDSLGHTRLKVYACSFIFPPCSLCLSKPIVFHIKGLASTGRLQHEKSMCHTAVD